MYKPPENTNRVKAIKSKFENNESQPLHKNTDNGFKKLSVNTEKKVSEKQQLVSSKNSDKQDFLRNKENTQLEKSNKQQLLSRQLSDPIKVNIKRTPAFRDKQFQRNGAQISCRVKGDENKLVCGRRSASPRKSCATVTNSTSFSNLRKRFDSQEDLSLASKPPQQALRERSNTSAEIILNRRKMCKDVNDNKKCFDSQENLDNSLRKTTVKILDIPKVKEDARYENIAFLYSEPVPKALRRKDSDVNDVHNVSTLKISDKVNSAPAVKPVKNLQNPSKPNSTCNTLKSLLQKETSNLKNLKNSNLKNSTSAGTSKFTGADEDLNFKLNALTDTLKLALKKPLPPGPAPKKPPRTFAHVSPNLQSKVDFEKRLNQTLLKNIDQKPKRSDPKYMLDKLESALKNNKIRLKRPPKIDYTSEEDNSESERRSNNSRMNFNCLQSLSCSNATYERIGDSKSEFYTDGRKEEPVYAEPFVFPPNNVKPEPDKKLNRNSLYYMSTPVSASQEVSYPDNMDDHGLNHSDAGDETSSLSTPSTSDVDSVGSTPSEENKKFMSSKIKELMKTFEPPSMEKRVDRLGTQLRHTLEHSFLPPPTENALPSAPSSTEGESKDARVGKYETYVKKIRMISKLRKKCDGSHLFYSCLLVGLDEKQPYIKFKFPVNVDLPLNVEHLCFPDAMDSSIDYSVKAQNYSIVLTDHLGKRIYGYCRRVLPEDSQKCLPLAYCILSKQRAGRFYRRILEELESRHGIPDKVRDIFLNELYYHQFPTPGQSVRFNLAEVNKHLTSVTTLGDTVELNGTGTYGTLRRKSSESENYNRRNGVLFQNGVIPQALIDDNELTNSISTPTELVITLHQDSRYKEKDLEELCNTLKTDILQKVFASLLLERKVIFISSLLGKLSTCIEAVQNMLYPFQWPHTLISVVPKDLSELVEAPTPLICGVLSLNIEDYDIQHGLVVNLDKGKILKDVGDEDKIIPCSLLKEFKDGMSLAHKSSKENECAFNVLLSDAFIRIFINSCGHYTDYIKEKHFQKEEFIQHLKSKSVRRFLTWFTETTMFCTFIETVMANPRSFSVFDKRIQIYSSPDVNLILEKMKDWKKEKSNTLFF